MAMEILSNRGQGELGRSRARTSGGAAGAGTFEDNVGLKISDSYFAANIQSRAHIPQLCSEALKIDLKPSG